ncbi:MAG TPA: hypothetical protein VGA49_02985 [Patescibacteria group bacterium]
MAIQELIKTEKLLFEKPDSVSASKPFTAESLPNFPAASRLIGVVSIDEITAENFSSLDSLIQEIKDIFSRKNEFDNFNSEEIFEITLKQVNKKVTKMIEGEKLIIKPNKFHCVIGLLTPDSKSFNKKFNLYLSAFGLTNAHLIHKTPSGDYKFIDIVASPAGSAGGASPAADEATEPNQSATEDKTPLKFFTNVVSGKINSTDTALLTTANLTDFISTGEIKKIISTLPPVSSIQHISNLLSEVTNPISIAAVIAQPASRERKQPGLIGVATGSSQDSMNVLVSTESATEKLLTPAMSLNIKKLSSALTDKLRSLTGGQNKQTDGRSESRKRDNFLVLSVKFLSQAGSNLVYILVNIFKGIINFLGRVNYRKLTDLNYVKNSAAASVQNAKNNLAENFKNIISWYGRLPKIRKYLLTAGIILIFIFTSSLFLQNRQKNLEAEALAYTTSLNEILDKKDKAEASIIFKEEDKAKSLLDETVALIADLPQNTNDRRDQAQILLVQIENLNDQLKHLIKIDNPAVIADLAPFDPSVNIQTFSVNKNKIFVTTSNQSELYQINLDRDNNIEKLELAGNQEVLLKTIAKDEIIYFYSDQNNLLKLDTINLELASLNLDIPADAKIEDLAIYNNRLYLLDSNNQQIYRYNQAGNDFAVSKTNWLRDNTANISQAVSLAIDANIYVLKSNGLVEKLLGGSRFLPAFSLSSVEPSLDNPSKIRTLENSEYIYVLEPANNRLVIFNKGGKFLNQYVSEKFKDLKDVYIDEANKTAYLINGTKIIKIELSHF